MKTTKLSQTILEYTVLIMAIVAAFSVMNKYLSRSVQARLKQIQEEVAQSTAEDIEYDVVRVESNFPSP